jgi:predicted nucleic acid-binding protein
MSVLLDTGFAVALFNRRDLRHKEVLTVMQHTREDVLFPVPATTETFYLLRRDAGTEVAARFVSTLADENLLLENPLLQDYQRAAMIIRQYANAKLDFVDALIVALAERLNVTRLLTLDQRDFRLVRPRHCAAFEILP